MLRVKDMYVSIKDIKRIKHIEHYGSHYLTIKYTFDDVEIKIEVEDFEEYVDLADMICEKINAAAGL